MENQERIDGQETRRRSNREITITKDDYSKAIKAEMVSIMKDPDFAGDIGAVLMMIEMGSAFAMAVWCRLKDKDY